MKNAESGIPSPFFSRGGNLESWKSENYTPKSHIYEPKTGVLREPPRSDIQTQHEGKLLMAKRHSNRAGDLESLFLRLEELVLANSGEDEFEEVFKLLIAKLWDEASGTRLFRLHASEQETAAAVIQLLRQAEKAWPGIIDQAQPRLTAEHLSVCVDALSKHDLSNESFEVLDSFFEFMVAKSQKGAKGQYFTPRHVVELCVRMLRPRPEETIVDPACGSGGFLIQALQFLRAQIPESSVSAYCSEKLWGFDIDSRAIRVARALMVLAGGNTTNVIRLNSLLQPSMSRLFASDDPTLTIEDVCRSRLRRHRGFDIVLTNPPFAGEVRERQLLDGYAVAARKPRIERDVLFVERCIQLMRPGGRMAIVLPHNKFASESYAYLREWLSRRVRILGVVGLGRNTFLPHTHQKASVLFLQRALDGEKLVTDYNIFFSISERDGKNSKGQFLTRDGESGTLWHRVDHDLGEVEHAFQSFCAHEGIEV